MLTSAFRYDLPDDLIAREPLEPRDKARLLVSRLSSELADTNVTELPSYLDSGDLLIVNNTKVLPARIPAIRKTGGKAEIFLLNRIGAGIWEALVKPSAKIENGEKVKVENSDIEIEIGQNNGEGHRIVTFPSIIPSDSSVIPSDSSVIPSEVEGTKSDLDIIHDVGQAPLPPYLGKVDISLDRYQTMFAKQEQSVAAPTAGLHFTPGLKNALKVKGIGIEEVTLHVGVGTFRPIMVDNVEDHKMHSEYYEVSDEVWQKIQETKKHGNKVIAVGTTSLRTLESVALKNELQGDTDIFCFGDFDFKVVDMLMTNFHQSESTLLVLLDAFIGSRWKDLYAHAIESRYRFLSFGDAMLIGKGRNK